MNHSILLVSSNIPALRQHEARLTRAGYSVCIARNVFEAEIELRATLFSLVITDLRMWRSDLTEGLRVIERVKALRTGMPILVLTSSTNLDLHRQARKLGVLDIISEETPLPELDLLIANILHEMYGSRVSVAAATTTP
jgi:two-component system, OmpR family, response regulator